MKSYLFQTQLEITNNQAPIVHYGFDFTIKISYDTLTMLKTRFNNCHYFDGI